MTANDVVSLARDQARHAAHRARLAGRDPDGWLLGYELGHVLGQILVAQHDMGASPILAQAARNEAKFLLGDYQERRHA